MVHEGNQLVSVTFLTDYKPTLAYTRTQETKFYFIKLKERLHNRDLYNVRHLTADREMPKTPVTLGRPPYFKENCLLIFTSHSKMNQYIH